MKSCSSPNCKQVNPQPLDCFYNNKSRKDGLSHACKKCVCTKKEDYRKSNPKKIAAQSKVYRETNTEKVAASKKAYYEANAEKITAMARVWYTTHREANVEKIAARNKAYYEANAEKIIAKKLARLKTDPIFKLSDLVRSRVRQALKSKNFKKNKRTFDLVGCTVEQLAFHLENQFKPLMTWENHGKWHIDHIVPLASADTSDELYALCHYTNLQPLWAEENLSKGDKVVDKHLRK